ncbi:nucleolar protein 4-like [Amphibalanus amphitrite]|uniref:nucleolar protein 4-like n=1 Tax=Amphibalanus amphitrite TaxID=1232801 RepID=UPI001C907702|nr:nucleolar protein 4-like [Amphibalanus amphitrite]
MDDLHIPFAYRPRKQSLSAIIERIVLEKQRQKERAVFEQQLSNQRSVNVPKVEPCELIEDSGNDSRSAQSQGDLQTSSFSQDGDSSAAEAGSQFGPKAPQSTSQEEDEELDEDDSPEREDANIDPERLKAFNLFVRLFADEHLDRTVPISKQPKERIQTIIDSCNRQFPEFEDRARKRLRTYLKACRRHKRLKEPLTVSDVAGPGRVPTGHLSSAQAEMILAQACENETRSAKRRQVLTPDADTQHQEGPPPLMQLASLIPPESSGESVSTSCVPPLESAPAPAPAPASAPVPGPAAAPPAPAPAPMPSLPPYLTSSGASGPAPPPVSAAERSYPPPMPPLLNHLPPTSAVFHADVGHLLRHVLPGRAGAPPPAPPSHSAGGDLFFRRAPHAPLTFPEAVAVRALVDGYRQSAGLLRRTADELEALIPHHLL